MNGQMKPDYQESSLQASETPTEKQGNVLMLLLTLHIGGQETFVVALCHEPSMRDTLNVILKFQEDIENVEGEINSITAKIRK